MNNGVIGSNRKYRISLIALAIIVLAHCLSFVLVLQGHEPLLQGAHLVAGLALVLGLYGSVNVMDKMKGGAG